MSDPTPSSPSVDVLAEDGPLADALLAIHRALVEVESARANVSVRRQEFVHTFRSVLSDHADDPDLPERFRAAVTHLYWDCPTLRLTEIAAATGLDNDRVKRVAGPRRAEVACIGCGAPTEVLRTSRSDRPPGRCPDCRCPVPGVWDDPPAGGAGGVPAWMPSLLRHLDERVRAAGCDNRLTLTRRWALREGFDEDAVVAAVERHGCFCDCEVMVNAPLPPGDDW